ncbi:histidine kinase [Bacillus cereus]|nr:histidine kinase [Bacillus cereus]
MKQGIKQGIEQGKMELIRGMHKNGVSVEDVAKLTGLTETEIQKFLRDE